MSRTRFAYVGSYTTPERNGQGNGINVYRAGGVLVTGNTYRNPALLAKARSFLREPQRPPYLIPELA